MLIGCARVSTRDRRPHLQLDALRDAGCERVFQETASGARRDRTELKSALEFMRRGDSPNFTVFSAIAEFERESNRERTPAGLDAARNRGRKDGRPRALSDKDLKQAHARLADPEIAV